MAYVGARVVYTLGKEVSRARELGQLSPGSAPRRRRHGRGVEGRPPLAGASGCHQADSIVAAGDRLGAGSDDMRRRFEREAQLIAQLRSPHTVTLFDFGVADDGSFYYVMELLDGLDADRMVRRFGPMPAERAVSRSAADLPLALEAESCGLVHRDIKPANIFLCRYGEDHDFVKVLDFGIAKPVHATPWSRRPLSRSRP